MNNYMELVGNFLSRGRLELELVRSNGMYLVTVLMSNKLSLVIYESIN